MPFLDDEEIEALYRRRGLAVVPKPRPVSRQRLLNAAIFCFALAAVVAMVWWKA